MLNWLKTLLQRLWKQQGAVSSPATTPPVSRRPRNEAYGPFLGIQNAYHISDLLDGLPAYFEDLDALRKVDEDAYSVFRTLGGVIATKDSILRTDALTRIAHSDLPAIACVFSANHGKEDDSGHFYPRIVYAIKLHGDQVCISRDGSGVRLPTNGTSYRIVVVYRLRNQPLAMSCFAHVSEEMAVKCLAETRHVKQSIPYRSTDGHRRVKYTGAFSRKEIRTPRWIDDLLAESGGFAATADEYVRKLLSLTVSAKRPEAAILVRAMRRNQAASWTISVNDAKRFFANRETSVASDGRRKRVLHYVGDFERSRGNRKQTVRAHYRGEREFDWNGYSIKVSGLGFHHKDFFAADISAFEDRDAAEKMAGKMVSLERASKLIRYRYNKVVRLGRTKAA